MSIRWIGECPDCVPQLARWHVAAFADVLSGWQVDEAAFELRGHLARRAVPTSLIAFDAAGELAGSVSLLASDAPAPDRHAPWLGTLFVRPSSRGQGLGVALVRAAVNEAMSLGLPALHLWTPAHADFYARLGWQSLGRRRYGGREVTLMRIDCARTP
jgi:predicted N-acetyltransferase YhbS